jgi:putative FmdB family regulatory protein
MPVYTYRREDGTTFDLRQKFSDDPLAVDPETGQRVVRLVQSTGVIFKGSGFYVNDSKSASKKSLNTPSTSKDSTTTTTTGTEAPKTDSVASSAAASSAAD